MNRWIPVGRRDFLRTAACGAAAGGLIVLGLGTGGSALAGPGRGRIPHKVLLIGLDGARYDKMQALDTPAFHLVAEQGYDARSTLPPTTVAPTVSGPGWSSILTGVWPDKHKVVNNSFDPTNLAAYPSVLSRVERAEPELTTYAALEWAPIATHILRSECDRQVVVDDSIGYDAADEKITADAERHLRTTSADASFVYLGWPDIAGHNWGAESPRYADALRATDARMGRLIQAIRSRRSYDEENWMVLVTTDHGHTAAGGHGGNSPEERMTFIVGAGGALPKGTPAVEPKVVDILPTMLRHLGIEEPAGLDGKPLNKAHVSTSF